MSDHDPAAPAGRRKGTGSNSVYEHLRARIIALELAPGAHLDEATLVATYGISRTPVREALIRLGSEGLVVLLPNRGARVSPIELGRLREFFEALDLCQRAATHWAALRRSEEELGVIAAGRRGFERAAAGGSVDAMNETNLAFHKTVARAAGNAYVARAYERLLEEGQRVSRISLGYQGSEAVPLAEHLKLIIEEHREMEARIRQRDGVGAERVAAAHARLFRDRVIANLVATQSGVIAVAPDDTP